MPEYQLVPTKTFLKDLKKIIPQYRKRIEEVLVNLKDDPYQGRKLTAVEVGQWRIRISDYRIRYDIEENYVVLHRLRHRKDIYKKV